MIKKSLFTGIILAGLTFSAHAADKWKIIYAGTLLADAREDIKTE
jgi:hypothetical protein